MAPALLAAPLFANGNDTAAAGLGVLTVSSLAAAAVDDFYLAYEPAEPATFVVTPSYDAQANRVAVAASGRF